MKYIREKLKKSEVMEKRIQSACQYNGASCQFVDGCILHMDKANISFISPHKVVVKVKEYVLLLFYFGEDNLFLHEVSNPIKISDFIRIIKTIHLEDKNE